MSDGSQAFSVEITHGLFWDVRVYEADSYWRGREEHYRSFWTKRGAVKWASDQDRVRRWWEKQRSVSLTVGTKEEPDA